MTADQALVELRAMTPADIPLGMRLKDGVGWNQTPEDWRMILDAGSGWVALAEGIAVGTAAIVLYAPAFSWVGMILVDPAFRRRGIGTALLKAAVATAKAHGAVRLDATPQGEPLYRHLGFEVEIGLVRMRRPGGVTVSVLPAGDGALRRVPLRDEHIAGVVNYDAPIFGARRAPVLTALYRRAPQLAFGAWQAGTLVGYCLGRDGSGADQIGPVVAEHPEIAGTLLRTALGACAGRDVIVDVPAGRPGWQAYLEALGFVPQRLFTRMYLGDVRAFGKPERQAAIAGPEIG